MKSITVLPLFLLLACSAVYSQSASVFYEKGASLQDAQQFTSAIDYYNEALALDPSFHKALFNRALCNMELANLNKAATDFDRILAQNAADQEALEMRGNIHFLQSNWQAAIACYSKLLERVSTVDIYVARANAYLQVGDVAAAKKDFQVAKQARPQHEHVMLGLGDIARLESDWETAELHYRDALKINARSFDAWMNLGVTLAQQSRPEQAVEAFSKAIEITPQSAAFSNRALAAIPLNDFETAEKDAEKAILRDPKNADGYYALGVAYLRQGFFIQAIPELNQAIALHNTNPDYFFMRAQAFAKTEDCPSALGDCKVALQLNPDYRPAIELAAKCGE